jgi:hypothetical protein
MRASRAVVIVLTAYYVAVVVSAAYSYWGVSPDEGVPFYSLSWLLCLPTSYLLTPVYYILGIASFQLLGRHYWIFYFSWWCLMGLCQVGLFFGALRVARRICMRYRISTRPGLGT